MHRPAINYMKHYLTGELALRPVNARIPFTSVDVKAMYAMVESLKSYTEDSPGKCPITGDTFWVERGSIKVEGVDF